MLEYDLNFEESPYVVLELANQDLYSLVEKMKRDLPSWLDIFSKGYSTDLKRCIQLVLLIVT